MKRLNKECDAISSITNIKTQTYNTRFKLKYTDIDKIDIDEKTQQIGYTLKECAKQNEQYEHPILDNNDQKTIDFSTFNDIQNQIIKDQKQKCALTSTSTQDQFIKPCDYVNHYLFQKLCEICGKSQDDDLLLLCDYCDDAYHTYCLTPVLKKLPETEYWSCPMCLNTKKQLKLYDEMDFEKNTSNKINLQASPSAQSDKEKYKCEKRNKGRVSIRPMTDIIKTCKECDNDINFTEQAKEFCIKCQQYFHQDCFNTKKRSILCKGCEKKVKQAIPRGNKTILNYFQVQADKNKQTSKQKLSDIKLAPAMKERTNVGKQSRIKKSSGQPQFKVHNVTSDIRMQLKQKEAMIFAFKSKNIEFDDNLRFVQKHCPPSMNDAALEPALQRMLPQNVAVFMQFKALTEKGDYCEVMIEQDKLQGFVVRAFNEIQENTLIAEYVGDVDVLRHRIFDKNDSIMDLLRTTRSQTSLVVCPERFGNLARFLSGINNECKDSLAKQNVQSARFNIAGHARVVLYAKRHIMAGELLYYDYNAGGFQGYPTSYFV